MNTKTLFVLLATLTLMVPLTALAGHHYHGGGYHGSGYHGSYGMGAGWDMSAMDADQNRALSFEEYSQGTLDRLRKGFERMDTNADGVIDEMEWQAIREAHGLTPEG